MKKKSIAASFLVVFLAVTFAVIGASFSAFVFKDTKIEVTKVLVSSDAGIDVFDDKNLKEKTTELKLSDMKLGVKPATGEVDSETQIPSTITGDGTTEGYYAKVWVKTSENYKIILKNIEIKSEKNENDVKDQRKNIFIAIKDVANSTKTLEEDETEIVQFTDISNTQELTFLIWLGSFANENLEGAKISFELHFMPV